MPTNLYLSDVILNNIKNDYLNNDSSNKISKNYGISKPKILRLLKEFGIVRNNNLTKDFYLNFWEEDNKWFGYWMCKECNTNIKFFVNKKSLINRTLKRKTICKKCSLLKQVGNGNPFYNKKHNTNSIIKMLINQHKTLKPISKPELSIANRLKELNYEFEIQKIILKPFDFYLNKFNLLIEFYGDYWHCNPLVYNSDYFNKKKQKTAKEIWEYDKNKIDIAKKNGYNCEIIWETDYKHNNDIILEIIKKYE